jgi:hypothetical protein
MAQLPNLASGEPYQNLLAAAQAAHDQGQYKEAVILGQTAVELFTEKVLGQLYTGRHVEFLKTSFEHLLINYNLGNDKVSRLYIALSEDPIKQAPFWSRFVAHTELRNDLVHEGKDATLMQSRASLDTIGALIEHIKTANQL